MGVLYRNEATLNQMFILSLLLPILVPGKLVSLFSDTTFTATSSWTSDCATATNVALLNSTTSWTNIGPYDPAAASYSLIAATCTISNAAPTLQYEILNDCVLILRSVCTVPSAYFGVVEWQGRSLALTPPDSIQCNASEEAVFVEWNTSLGSFESDNGTFTISFTAPEWAHTQWLITNYVQVQCEIPWNTTKNLIIIVSCALGVVLLILAVVICTVRRCLLQERYYFSLNKSRKRRCKCC